MNRGILATCYARPAAGPTCRPSRCSTCSGERWARRAVHGRHRRLAVDQGDARLERRARHRPLRRAHRARWSRSPPSTTSPRAPAAVPSRPPTSRSASTRRPASPRSAWRRDGDRRSMLTSPAEGGAARRGAAVHPALRRQDRRGQVRRQRAGRHHRARRAGAVRRRHRADATGRHASGRGARRRPADQRSDDAGSASRPSSATACGSPTPRPSTSPAWC